MSCKTPQDLCEPYLYRFLGGRRQAVTGFPSPPSSSRGARRGRARRRHLTSCFQLASLSRTFINKSKLSTTDLLVLASMKNAAKCDK